MSDPASIHHPAFDTPAISERLFYPRREPAGGEGEGQLTIPLGDGVFLGARLHGAHRDDPVLLFFHGNGEIVSDYDEIGEMYRRRGINFLPVDYRGYGRSSGRPTLTAMLRDGLASFDYLEKWLHDQGRGGPVLVMGRSLGSAPALTVAYHRPERIAGLIIESGFAAILPLLRLMGYHDPGLREEEGPQNLEKIRHVQTPTLIIHGTADEIIDVSEGRALYESAGAREKFLLEIPAAGHNDLFLRGMQAYLQALEKMVAIARKPAN